MEMGWFYEKLEGCVWKERVERRKGKKVLSQTISRVTRVKFAAMQGSPDLIKLHIRESQYEGLYSILFIYS